MEKIDCVVIGAGVIGLAVAARLSELNREVIVVEKNLAIGAETSSRNSEVIHAGIYYPNNSIKAKMCVQGRQLLYKFCENNNVPHKRCGKVIVATNKEHLNTVKRYADNALANGVVDLEWLSERDVNVLEPDVISVGGLLSPSTGIVDSHDFMLKLQAIIESHGGVIAFGEEVVSLESNPNTVVTENYNLNATWIINCAGLNAPHLSRGTLGSPRSIYAKGHYFSYSGKNSFSRLVYPIAEEGGLGVHVTLDMAGNVKFGPDVHWVDKVDYSFEGGLKDRFEDSIRRYYPGLDGSRLEPSYTGIRPKIMYENTIYPDFMINSEEVHGLKGRVDLLGIESPGLTSSLALADHVCSLVDLAGY